MIPRLLGAGLIAFGFFNWASALPKSEFPVTIHGADDLSFIAKRPKGPPIVEKRSYDAVIVGSGLSGLTAAFFLSEQGRRVLILEKSDRVGGLAYGDIDERGIPYSRGAAYWAPPTDEQEKILGLMGLGNTADSFSIPEPIDGYLWGDKLYLGVWSKETLKSLPPSFELFEHEIKLLDKAGQIPVQPIEEQKIADLDKLSAFEWIRKMPEAVRQRTDDESKRLAKLLQDPRIPKDNPMRDVLDFLDLYCRSALGTTCDQVSAVVFAHFYIAEFDNRLSTPMGTGHLSRTIHYRLGLRPHLVTVRTKANVNKMYFEGNGVEVEYQANGRLHRARASYAVYAAQVKFAPQIIDGLGQGDSEKVRAIKRMSYAHYDLHVVKVKGHPWRATYDLWTRPKDYSLSDFTDVVLGRWVDPSIRGYEGYRDFASQPPDDEGIFTIYHPFYHGFDTTSRPGVSRQKHATAAARRAVKRLIEIMTPVLAKEQKIVVRSVETNLWPFSMHIVRPGFFTKEAPLLRRPFKRVYFAHNNLGAPAIEEAIFRGHCAANNILIKLDPEFKQEPWTNCHLE